MLELGHNTAVGELESFSKKPAREVVVVTHFGMFIMYF